MRFIQTSSGFSRFPEAAGFQPGGFLRFEKLIVTASPRPSYAFAVLRASGEDWPP